MNSKPNETGKTPPTEPMDDSPPKDDPKEADSKAEVPKTEVPKNEVSENPEIPEKDDPKEDDPVSSLDSSVDSDEFKCKHCEVDPFPNENELKQHIKIKHEIKVSKCL